MADIIPFKGKGEPSEPIDDVTVCTITIASLGDVSLWVNDYIETIEQHNWLIAKIAAASSAVITRKQESTQ